jgi:Asp-tRNA(Asn)/Glu-tRNA(Gln) amidotransferase A subunit family amidase
MTSPIAAIAASVRAKKVSAVEVAEEAIRRVSAANPTLNFLSDEYFDDGRKDASTVPMGPLAGVPLLVKDLEDRQGWPTRKGSLLYKDAKPATENSPSVQRLLDAGCIAIGKSTLPEFAIEGFTANRQSGITRNPWNVDYSPGGSSGGSAAAVSAGAIGIGTATDGGGSVRIPASLCGLVGLKPTNGVIGRWPAHDWIDCSTDGVFTTTVEDLELVMSVQAGPIAGDPNALSPVALTDALTVRKPQNVHLIAATRTSDFGPLPVDVEREFRKAVDQMEGLLGVSSTWKNPGTFTPGGDPDLDWFTICSTEHMFRVGRELLTVKWDVLDVASQAFMEQGLKTSVDEYMAARIRRFEYVRNYDELLGQDTFLLTPAVAAAGWLADGRVTEDAPVGQLPPEVYSTAVQNILGLPAISLPAGMLDSGVPFGIQITGPRWSDGQLLALAREWEAQFPWPLTAPGYEPLDAFLK